MLRAILNLSNVDFPQKKFLWNFNTSGTYTIMIMFAETYNYNVSHDLLT